MRTLPHYDISNTNTILIQKYDIWIWISIHALPGLANLFDASGLYFNGEELSIVDETTLVGLRIDNKMRWGPMVKKLATKARQRIGAL